MMTVTLNLLFMVANVMLETIELRNQLWAPTLLDYLLGKGYQGRNHRGNHSLINGSIAVYVVGSIYCGVKTS